MVHSSDLCKEKAALQETSFLFFFICLLHLITEDSFYFAFILIVLY